MRSFSGAAIRIGTIGHEDLWGDELFSRRVALLPLHPALAAIEEDLVHPPLYYLLLKAGITIWGASPVGIRLLSLVFGLATVTLAAFIGKNLLCAPNIGLLAAAMFAVNQNLVFYSQEARSYSLYTFLVMLLVFWVWAAASNRGDRRILLWLSGWLLMVVLVYTHYVGALYVASAVTALWICNVPRRTKVRALLSAFLAALCFVPWIFAVMTVYQARHGQSDNFGWQVVTPGFIDMAHLWASAFGILDVRGGATFAFLLVAVLSLSALLLRPQGQRLRDSPALVVLALFGSLPPAVLFALSRNPFNLHLFMTRQLLPSDAALCLICCYGVESLARRFRLRYTLAFAAGSAIALIAAAAPAVQNGFRPYRFPFHTIAQDLKSQKRAGWEIYASSFYLIGYPANFYCETGCVQWLPQDFSVLPKTLIFLYDPKNLADVKTYQELLNDGFGGLP